MKVFMLSLLMLIGISFAGNAEQNQASAAVDAGACENWVTVYPVNCPEQYFHLCMDNYKSLDKLEDEAYRQGGMRCN